MGKREVVALLSLSSWCLVMVEGLFLAVPWGYLRFVIVVFPDHTHLLSLFKYNQELLSPFFCGSFLLNMFHVCLYYNNACLFLAAL